VGRARRKSAADRTISCARKTGRKLAYGELVEAASNGDGPEQRHPLKTPDQFRYIGKDIPIVDLKPIVTGKATFGIDAHMPGMVYAAIERPR
jgi:isoquinoline 1-oxidoreductase subunit beta